MENLKTTKSDEIIVCVEPFSNRNNVFEWFEIVKFWIIFRNSAAFQMKIIG